MLLVFPIATAVNMVNINSWNVVPQKFHYPPNDMVYQWDNTLTASYLDSILCIQHLIYTVSYVHSIWYYFSTFNFSSYLEIYHISVVLWKTTLTWNLAIIMQQKTKQMKTNSMGTFLYIFIRPKIYRSFLYGCCLVIICPLLLDMPQCFVL